MHADPTPILNLASTYWDSCVLFAANDAGLFAALANEPMDADRLAEACNLDPRGCQLLADAAVAVGLLVKTESQYANTPEADTFLVPGRPGDLSQALRYNRDVYAVWGHLTQLARTGQAVERPELHLGDDAQRTRAFVLSMHSRALAIGRAVVPLLDLGGAKRLLDVGGGPGTYSALIAKANPTLHCTMVDLPAVATIASELLTEQDMTDRVTVLPGDYHQADFPANQDAVLFFGVLHQESPETIVDLFTRARKALNPGSKLYVMDMMTDATRTAPKFSALFAVNMALTTTHGWVFSDADLAGWLARAGFEAPTITPLPAPMPHWLASARLAE